MKVTFMQAIEDQNQARRSIASRYNWRLEEVAMVNTLMDAAWHHEMDQRSFISTKVYDVLMKIEVARRRILH